MKHVDEFRDPQLIAELLRTIRRTATKPWTLMEVCGGQTHGLLKYGIPQELHECVETIHGPGCPVCVTPESVIDAAQVLARTPGLLLTTFGDMLRVPGSSTTLQEVRSQGGRVRAVSSPLDALRMASADPTRQIVFLAVGFETTAPASALAVRQAAELGLQNFTVLPAHVRVLPAMELLMQAPDCRVEGFLAAGHVCAITGTQPYEQFVRRFGTPIVVTGFEPVDLLGGMLECVRQLEQGTAHVANCYGRAVTPQGNLAAQQLIDSVYEVADQPWRGLGIVPRGGYRLKAKFAAYDAFRRFPECQHAVLPAIGVDPASSRCRADRVLSGQLLPCDCPEFGADCTPDHPLGAPMVSSEGACAAWYRYAGSMPGSPAMRTGE